MHIFDVAGEIRLKIYSELLVLSEQIVLVADYGPSSRPIFRPRKKGLCPILLRINKRIYKEAIPLLYSNNRFQFPEISNPTATDVAHIAPFLRQIGYHANHIRYICIPFPTSMYPQPHSATLHRAHVENLDLVRNTCTSIRTLELLVSPDSAVYALSDSRILAEALGVLDTHFKSISSLKKIVVNFKLYPEHSLSDDLRKEMHDYGWTIRVTQLPQRTWISRDSMVEFDNEEDCDAYDDNE